MSLVLFVSCGGGDGSSVPDGGITGDGCDECGEFETVLESICGGIDRCPDFVYPIGYRSQGECVAILAWATTCQIDDDAQDVDEAAPLTFARRIPEIGEEEAQACATYIDNASCDELNALMQGRSEDTPCVGLGNADDALSGSSDGDDGSDNQEPDDGRNGEGEQCNGGSENCEPDLYCHQANSLIEGSFSFQCPTCLPRPKLGEPCRPYYEPCLEGLRCLQGEGRTGYDYYGQCSELAEVGEPCGDRNECKSGFCWEEGFREDWECREGGDEGDPCNPRGGCLDGFVCIGPDGSRTCTAEKLNGEACQYDNECVESRHCDLDGKCGLPESGEERCSRNEDCRSGYCSRTNDRCAATVALGESCEADAQCGDGVCGRSSNTCIEDFCQSDADCAETQFCGSDAECVDRRSEGANCFTDQECLSNYCNSDERCGQETTMGGPCESNSQCYPWGACEGGMCVPLKDPEESCTGLQSCKPPFICQDGTCELINISCVPAKVGEPCASLRVCEAEATCDFVNGLVCKPRAGQGESCIRPSDCTLDLYCAGSRTCQPRPSAGEACDSDMPCAQGFNCVYDSEREESTCVAEPVGDHCDSQTPCPEGYRCEANHCAPPLEVGDACDPFDVEECPAGSYCDDETSVCTDAPIQGEACDREVPCADGFHCNETLMECVDDLTDGAACDYPGADCVDGYGCVPDDLENTSGPKSCRMLKADGEDCITGLECLSGSCLTLCEGDSCLSSVCVDNMCVPPAEVAG